MSPPSRVPTTSKCSVQSPRGVAHVRPLAKPARDARGTGNGSYRPSRHPIRITTAEGKAGDPASSTPCLRPFTTSFDASKTKPSFAPSEFTLCHLTVPVSRRQLHLSCLSFEPPRPLPLSSYVVAAIMAPIALGTPGAALGMHGLRALLGLCILGEQLPHALPAPRES